MQSVQEFFWLLGKICEDGTKASVVCLMYFLGLAQGL